MPELPDLQVFSHNLNKSLAGKKLVKIEVLNNSRLKTTEQALKKELEKEKLEEVFRVGKELHFKFSNDNILGLHLMLHGQLFLDDEKETHKHTIIKLSFNDGQALSLADYQGMATPTLNPEEREAPDALEVDYTFLKEKLNKRSAIKKMLLDQHVIRGIGNAYADEILWEAGISPFSIANKIPDDKIKALAKAIKSVLHDAEKQIKKTHPDIISGEVRDFLKIHNSKKKESPTGGVIKQQMVASRKTYFTEEQEEYK
ncbi:MAG: DNA-formamidopyrimidine glycosylase [Chitinophagaceae bacterium]|nr:DNA-formamidopyrimidine glycosylase [Chitinophagaceae bacterium]